MNDQKHNWTTFAVSFIGMFPFIEHNQAPIECAWSVGETLKETAENFRRTEAPFAAEVEGVIHTFCQTGTTPKAARTAQYFLGLRSAVLESLFLKFSINKSRTLNEVALASAAKPQVIEETIIPFPSLPTLQVLEWFLIDWWRKQGAIEVAQLRYLEAFLGDD